MMTHQPLIIALLIFTVSVLALSILAKNNASFAEMTNSNKTLNKTLMIQPKISKPEVIVKASCQVAQTAIPGEFIATGFMPNNSITIKVDRNNSTQGPDTEPITLLFTKTTDSRGNVTGEFTLNTQIQQPNYKEFFLHVFSSDNGQNEASASLKVC